MAICNANFYASSATTTLNFCTTFAIIYIIKNMILIFDWMIYFELFNSKIHLINYHLRNMMKYFCENLQRCWNMRFFLLNNFCYIIQVIFRWSRNLAFTLTWRNYGEIFMFMIDYFFPFTCRINLFSKPFTRNNKYYSVLKVSCWQTGLEFNN